MPDGLKIFILVIFLTIHQGWNYWLHLVREKSSLEKPNWLSDVSPALLHRAGAPPTGKYKPILQMGMLGLNEIKGLSWRSELVVGRIGAWIQMWDDLSQASSCTLGERRKTMTWWRKRQLRWNLTSLNSINLIRNVSRAFETFPDSVAHGFWAF